MTKSIGDLLISRGIATSEQIRICTEKKADRSLEQCLIDEFGISSESITKAYAEYAGLPFVESVTDAMADLNILAKVPFKFLRDNTIMPVIINGTVTILTANPFNFQ